MDRASNERAQLRTYRVEVKSGGSLGTSRVLIRAATKQQARTIAKARAPKYSVVGTAELITGGRTNND